MKKIHCLLLALASLSAATSTLAATFSEDFSNDPSQRGWNVFGDATLFEWNPANEHLEVTWDSSRPNSYFHLPLGTVLARDDDFSLAFDLFLNDIASDTEPGKTGPMQIAIGFQNFTDATNSAFARATFGGTPNLVEFNYFCYGFYDFGGIFDVNPTTTPAFISSGGFSYAPSSFQAYEVEFPTNVPVRVEMNFTAENQTMTLSLSTNGVIMTQLPDLILSANGFGPTDDFRVDTVSIINYRSGDFDSVLAHGYVDNLTVTIPPPPVQNLALASLDNPWGVQFQGRTNWLYTLERTIDFQTWNDASDTVAGVDGIQALSDNNAPEEKAFYRVRASRP